MIIFERGDASWSEVMYERKACCVGDEVHFHNFTGVELRPKQRMTLPIFEVEDAYEDVYTATVPANHGACHARDTSFDIIHKLKVRNNTDKPWY